MQNHEIVSLARQAAKEAVHAAIPVAIKQTLLTLGINAEDPIKTQADFATLREVATFARDSEWRKDMEHTRRWRKAVEQASSKGFLTVVGIISTGLAGAAWVGIRAALGK
jgi:hypothetical protein